MRFYYNVVILLVLSGCAKYQSKFNRKYISYTKELSTRTEIPQINDSTMLISVVSEDMEYARVPSKPVMLGMATRKEGAENIEKYLNALTGLNGEEVFYKKFSPCCPFKTVNAADEKYFKSDFGLLEMYKVYHHTLNDTIIIYLNLYDEGLIQAPKGFKARKN
ncbi:MAG: hypothetical protein KF845_01125 [Cyclobacteriaceae bacterium]|nr:hypothetical protein [Cyclobacteriaceae bacterium]